MRVKTTLFLLARNLLLSFSILLLAYSINAEADGSTAATTASLDEEIQSLKKEVLAINRSLFMLEEELLFPSSTQIAVFVSMDVGKFFSLDSVQLKIDDKVVSNYLYTQREVDALHRGGVQRLYMGNLKSGEHELIAVFTGKGPNGRDYRRGADLVVNKSLGARFVELKIVDNESSEQPDFSIKEWE
ncbi:MAG TPA: AraC family transcriptional regulator [Gammaproteobacteria bacterium]|nr:AraC family transcriptional regulator [Gammaproteobacteria bacterium]